MSLKKFRSVMYLKTLVAFHSKTKQKTPTRTMCQDAILRIHRRKNLYLSMFQSTTDNFKSSTMLLVSSFLLPSTSAVNANLFALLSVLPSYLSQNYMITKVLLNLLLLTLTMKSYKSLTNYLNIFHHLLMFSPGKMVTALISLLPSAHF